MPDLTGAIGPIGSHGTPHLASPHTAPSVVVPLSPGTLPADTSVPRLVDPALRQGRRAITEKAASLGRDFTGAEDGPTRSLPAGAGGEPVFAQRYAGCTIYYTPGTGAHEVHGAIRHKYDQLDGVRRLGPPVTDETGCPDGRGRFNHFARDGSIYWHPDTGPFAVSGRIRQLWAARGWERGALGYPVRDQFPAAAGVEACLFENGALSSQGDRASDAAQALLSRDELLAAVWRIFDRLVHQSPDNVGLHPHRSLDGVGRYTGDLQRSLNRVVSLTINGFRDNGLAPDADWAAHLRLRLHDQPRSDGSDLFATHLDTTVDASGLGSGSIARGIANAIADAFTPPMRLAAPANPADPTFPAESAFIGALVHPDGAFGLLFCDTLPGRLAAVLARRAMEGMLE